MDAETPTPEEGAAQNLSTRDDAEIAKLKAEKKLMEEQLRHTKIKTWVIVLGCIFTPISILVTYSIAFSGSSEERARLQKEKTALEEETAALLNVVDNYYDAADEAMRKAASAMDEPVGELKKKLGGVVPSASDHDLLVLLLKARRSVAADRKRLCFEACTLKFAKLDPARELCVKNCQHPAPHLDEAHSSN